MRGRSLQDVMRAVAARVEAMPERSAYPVRVSEQTSVLSELEAFAALDPLLASLRKDFLDTKAHATVLTAKNGRDDPMAQVAADLQDSAWCAMQTRYLELRAQRSLMRKAQRLVHQSEDAEQKRREKKRTESLLLFIRQLQALDARKKHRSISLFDLIFILLFADPEFFFQVRPYYCARQTFAA